ncbi:transposase [Mesorhizobium sp. M1006]|uniref:transposase n=1 Tax=Mesorhizobium sp. M1006 TaxID=2957048 RepID=UPI003338C0BF
MHVEAMNWSGMGHAEYAAALGLSPNALRIWRDRLKESGDDVDCRSLLHPSARAQLSSAANCARRKYRLTSEAVDGRSNRRRFSDEQKRAIVQETEKPGVSVAEVCRRRAIATIMAFRWRVQFGLTARKGPQLGTVALIHAPKPNRRPTDLRNLVRPPDGMMAVQLDGGRRVFASVGSNADAVKLHLAARENHHDHRSGGREDASGARSYRLRKGLDGLAAPWWQTSCQLRDGKCFTSSTPFVRYSLSQ